MNLSPSDLNDDDRMTSHPYDMERVRDYLTSRKAMVSDIEALRVLWLHYLPPGPVMVDGTLTDKEDDYFPAIMIIHRRSK